jgi:4-alpha-glucanotransferase
LQQEVSFSTANPPLTEQFAAAVHTYLARTHSLIALIQLDDITAETDQVNVPATSDERPNWRRRLSLSLEELASHSHFNELAHDFRRERATKQMPREDIQS